MLLESPMRQGWPRIDPARITAVASRNAQPNRHGQRLFRQVGLGWPEALNRSEIPSTASDAVCWLSEQPPPRPPKGCAAAACSSIGRCCLSGVISIRSDAWHQALPSATWPGEHSPGHLDRRSTCRPKPNPWPSITSAPKLGALTPGVCRADSRRDSDLAMAVRAGIPHATGLHGRLGHQAEAGRRAPADGRSLVESRCKATVQPSRLKANISGAAGNM